MIPLFSIICVTGISYAYVSLLKYCSYKYDNEEENENKIIDEKQSKCKFF